jgi:multiple sugar transport system substrate-binding protein
MRADTRSSISRRTFLLRSGAIVAGAGSLALVLGCANQARPSGPTATPAVPATASKSGSSAVGLDPSAKVTVDYWRFSLADAEVEAIVKQFNEQYPNVTIKQQFETDYLALIQKAQAASAAQTPPALIQVGYTLLNYVAENLPHLTIEEAAKRDPSGAGMSWLTDNFAPNVLDTGRINGVLHGMPYSISNPVLFYNLMRSARPA